MRILIINQPYWPDVVATAQHMTDWAADLTARGHVVTVLASRSVYGQSGAVLAKREVHEGVRIYRVGGNVFGKRGVVMRAADAGLFFLQCLVRALTLPKQDVVVCLTSPPFIGVVGMVTQWVRGSRYVQYEMDVYPEVAVALGALKSGSVAVRVLGWVHGRMLRAAARVVVLGRCMRKVIAGLGVPENKIVLVTPWADPNEIVPVPAERNLFRKEHRLEDAFIVMYSGNLGLGHDITTICGAMAQVAAEGDGGGGGVRFVFIGGGKRMPEIEKRVGQGHGEALLLEYQPRERLDETLSAADVHLITQAPGTTGLIVPSKLYGILAAGRPVIYIGPADTEVALAIAEHGLGKVLEIGDVAGLVRGIREYQAADRRGLEDKARSVLRERFSRAVCCGKLTAMVEGIGAGQPQPKHF